MQLGLVTYNWGKDWDLPTLFDMCQKTGFKGVELRTTHKHGVEPTLNEKERLEVAARFADSGITLVGLGSVCEYHSPDPEVLKKNIEETKVFIRLCHDVGGSGVKVRPNGVPEGADPQKTFEQIGKALREVAAYGEGYGVEIRLEAHGAVTQEIPNCKTMLDIADHPNARLCWNSNPADLNGKGLEHNFNLARPLFGATMHVHDMLHPYPWKELFTLLKKSNYEGWTLVEDGVPLPDPVRVMKYYRLVWDIYTGNDEEMKNVE